MKIKQKLVIVLLLIGLLPTLTVSTVAYVTISNELQQKTSEQLTSIAIKQEQKISSLLQGRQEEVTKLANRFDFQVALGNYLVSGKEADKTTINNILQSKKIEIPDIQTITLVDPQGKILATTQMQTNGQRAVVGNTNSDVTIQEDSRDGLNKLYIRTIVSVNKKEAATMSVVFRTDDIVAAIQDYTGLGATGETVIAQKDVDGNAVSLFPLRFDTDAALKTNLNSLNLYQNNGVNVAIDYRNQKVLMTSRSIGFADWTIGTKLDREEAFEPIVQLRTALSGIVAVSSLIIIGIALYFARFIARPIIQIARAAQRIGRGDFTTVETSRSDEIGDLGKSINTMGTSLQNYIARIQSQRNRLEVILNSTTESILASDKQSVILLANQASSELTQLNSENIVGKRLQDIFSWQHDGQPFEINYDTLETRIYPNLQYTNAAGNTHFVKLIVAKVAKEQGDSGAQTIITIHDETKSRELENMKIDFVSMAAHELRTPLAAIRGYLELIAFKTKQATTDVDGYIKQALKSAGELGGLINNLLDVTRIERGTLTLTMGHTDLAQILTDAVRDLQFNAQEKQITVTYRGTSSGCFVLGDHIALREVINNLLTNAIKYTQPKGSVSVSLLSDGKTYKVDVKDTGIGIPSQAIPHLFTKFYRVHGGLDSGSTGTGLGLFISKSIIERHKGTVSVTSQENVGSTFTFTIPAIDEKQAATLQSNTHENETMRRHRGWVTKNITR